MKNWLLVASFVLCGQFQNSTLAMMCEKIKVGFHYLNLTYSQTSYNVFRNKLVKTLEIKIDYNIRLCLIFKASHLWDASRIWVKSKIQDGGHFTRWPRTNAFDFIKLDQIGRIRLYLSKLMF